jgi:ABC-type amino acid transport substrate-binding protein
MRRLVAGGGILGGLALLSGGSMALACGVRFQRAYAGRQANVVIYSSGTQSGTTLGSARLHSTLTQAGHKLQTVQGASQLSEALKCGKVDVVLADLADLAGITRELQSAPSIPVVLPVLFKPSKAELAAAQKQYKLALKATADEVHYLTAIDEAMKLRSRTGAKS